MVVREGELDWGWQSVRSVALSWLRVVGLDDVAASIRTSGMSLVSCWNGSERAKLGEE